MNFNRTLETTDGELNLGSCCICEGTKDVRNIITIEKKLPIPTVGGWGCFACNLPSEGAVAVICDDCLEQKIDGKAELKFACVGYPGSNERIPIGELVGEHRHDSAFHPEENQITLIEGEM